MSQSFTDELALGINASVEAGRLVCTQLQTRQASPRHISLTRARFGASHAIIEAIAQAFPEDAVLCAETKQWGERLNHNRIWIINPLDGGFDAGPEELCIMLAFMEAETLQLGIIYKPLVDVMYFAVRGRGAFKRNGAGTERLACTPSRNGLRVIGPNNDNLVAELSRRDGWLDVEVCESMGAKCGRLVEGSRDLLIRAYPPLTEWDTAAAEIILKEAGGSVTDCKGHDLLYNKPVPLHANGIMAAHPSVAFRLMPTLLRVLNGHTRTPTS